MPSKKKVELNESPEIDFIYADVEVQLLMKIVTKSKVFSDKIYLNNIMKMNFLTLLSCLL